MFERRIRIKKSAHYKIHMSPTIFQFPVKVTRRFFVFFLVDFFIENRFSFAFTDLFLPKKPIFLLQKLHLAKYNFHRTRYIWKKVGAPKNCVPLRNNSISFSGNEPIFLQIYCGFFHFYADFSKILLRTRRFFSKYADFCVFGISRKNV